MWSMYSKWHMCYAPYSYTGVKLVGATSDSVGTLGLRPAMGGRRATRKRGKVLLQTYTVQIWGTRLISMYLIVIESPIDN